ncbi:MAG TPA: dihydropteroate synthase [Terriglobales bacterium]|nr:dihydropteroate synthase [Terriglobales bacterium]
MLIIGEKINGTRKLVNKAVLKRDAEHIRRLAVAQVEAGADVLDINAGTESEREPEDMVWLINVVQDAVDKPLSLDSPNPNALLAGLSATRQAPIINSISAEEDRLRGILPIVAQHNCRVLALALDGTTISPTSEGRLAIVRRVLEETRKAGVPDENVFVDSLVMSVATDSNACQVTLATMRAVHTEFPKVHLTAGLSNVSFGLPARTLVNRVFLTLALEAGLDSAIMDPTDRGLMETLYAANTVLGCDRHCAQYCRAYRSGKIGPKLEERTSEEKKAAGVLAAPFAVSK